MLFMLTKVNGMSLWQFLGIFIVCNILGNNYTRVCPPVGGDNPRALASGLSPAQADKTWYNYFIPPPLISVDIVQFEIFCAKVGDFWQG